jgi:hypothetical protein
MGKRRAASSGVGREKRMTTPEQKREQRLQLLDDQIGAHLRAADAQAELRRAPSYGKPLHFGDGYDATPAELRMPMKVLKDAGVLPAEVEWLREAAALEAALAACSDDGERRALQQRLADKRQQIALRLEHLRATRAL